jgi:hypothetical protein
MYRLWQKFLIYGIVSLIFIFMAGCSEKREDANTYSLSKFIIGRWQTQYSLSGNGGTEAKWIQIEFLDSGSVILNIISSSKDGSKHIDYYNYIQRFHFVGENSIQVKGRLIETWNLSSDGSELSISNSMIIPNGAYARVPEIRWPVIAAFLAIMIVISIFLFRKYLPIRPSLRKSIITKKVLIYVIGTVISATILLLGVILGFYAWSSWHYLVIQLPWDSLLFFELSIIILIAGIFLVTSARKRFVDNSIMNVAWKLFGGALLVGFAFSGFFFSVFALFVFVVLGGSYGYGA